LTPSFAYIEGTNQYFANFLLPTDPTLSCKPRKEIDLEEEGVSKWGSINFGGGNSEKLCFIG
jgi:hypothetical protein